MKMLAVRKMNKNGLVTIPVEIRRSLGWKKGDTVSITRKGNILVVRKVPKRESYKIDAETKRQIARARADYKA